MPTFDRAHINYVDTKLKYLLFCLVVFIIIHFKTNTGRNKLMIRVLIGAKGPFSLKTNV